MDVGIDDDFIKQVREKVTEGTSALFALTSGATAVDRVVDELKAYDFEIISTNLPEEQEKHLREAFAQEQQGTTSMFTMRPLSTRSEDGPRKPGA